MLTHVDMHPDIKTSIGAGVFSVLLLCSVGFLLYMALFNVT